MTVLNPPVRDSNMANVQENVPNNVKVIVRVRPPNDLELHGQGKHVVEIMDENVLVFDPKDQSSPFLGRYGKRQRQDIRKRRQKDLKFAFDYVFGWDSSNSDVFEQTTKTVLDGLLGGYNCSVFAYGATGAGKTHTMLGNESNPGVIYHTMIHLYRHITEMSPEKTCDVAVSYLEVYNEQIRDLLMPRGTLPIREDQHAGVIVPGLSLHKPSTAEELLHMLQFGNKNRTQHPTDANAESSRSHAVFQVFVRQRERTANISAQVKVAKMCLVDLAGSERATLTKNRGIRFREGANINRSLLALGNVINSLADHKYKGHIPYRDSKLTRLLKDSLGGNCRTIMIAAVSPSELSYEDTYNTLKYADRAKNIRLNMKKNVLSVDFHVSQYGKIVEELRREITELKSKLQQCERPAVSYAESLCLPSNLQSLHDGLQAAYSERRALRDQQLRQEITLRHTHWRLYRKHKCLRRVSLLTHALPGRVQKIQGEMEGLQRKVVFQETGRQSLCQQLHSNTQDLHALHAKLAGAHNKTSVSSQVLDMSVQKMALEVEVNDSRHYIHHLRRLARAQEQEAMASETLITALLQLVQRQQLELQRCGAQSPDIAAGYHSVCDLVGQVGVSWADGEEDQVAFHINSIIDIPLVTSAGVVLNRVRSPGHPTTGSSVHLGVSQGWTNSVSSCPGPVVNNGQGVSSTHSASLLGSSSHPGPLPSDPGRGHQGTFTVPSTTLSLASSPSLCVSDSHGAASPAPPLNPGAVVTHLSTHHQPHPHISSSSSSSTIHAGHTPNAKTLQHQTHSHQGVEVVAGPREMHFAHDHRETGSDCILPPPPLPPALNSTFTVHHGVIDKDSRAEEGNSTVVLKGYSQPCLPVVDSEGLPCVEESTGPRESVGAIHADRSLIQSDRRSGGQHGQVSSSAGPVPVSSGQSAHNPQNKCTSNGAVGDPAKAQSQGAQHRERPQNENDGSCPNRSSSVRRAINFDAANLGSTPLRVEGKSYADAVRTPTPPRQPLRTLDCNSPQLQAKNLVAGEAQTPKNGGRGSGYIAGPQALDNMRRLKLLGMPSLVENLVTGHKAGVSETSRPGYMQPTKAAARRMRRQPLSKDDCFNPRRVPNKSLAHSRSKSTSQLNRIGWKI